MKEHVSRFDRHLVRASSLFFLSLSLGLIGNLPTQAQVIPDGTVGTAVTDGPNFTIEGGTRPDNGPNLFHSFQEFSVPTGGSAFFDNAPDVVNIISRVTGSNLSNIDGLIQANGTANLILINPAGIAFGPNATLNIGGSFLASTVSSVKFLNGTEFSATNSAPAPLLTINVPVGLQMGPNPSPITSNGSQLQVPGGQTLALIGGDLTIQGSSLSAPDGHIELGSAGSNSLVGVMTSPQGWTFGYGGVTRFQDITLSQVASVDVSGNGGGTIQLVGNKIQLTEGSGVAVNTLGTVSGSSIIVRATDSFLLVGTDPTISFPTGLFTSTQPGASGDSGNIFIQTPDLRVLDAAQIGITGNGSGNLGSLTVQADRITVSGFSPDELKASSIYTSKNSSTSAQGGDITLNTQQLTFSEGGLIYSETQDNGNAGSLTVQASTIDGFSTSSADISVAVLGSITTGQGNSGTVNLTTQQLTLTGGAQIISVSFGNGDGGDINIKATDIHLDRGSYTGGFSNGLNGSVQSGTGHAGNINVQAQSLTLLNGAQIYNGTSGFGDGGKITIQAHDITMAGTGQDPSVIGAEAPSVISTSINPGAVGNTGEIEITTQRLTLANGAQVSSGVFGTGTGGNITIQANDLLMTGVSAVQQLRAGVFTTTTDIGQGDAGNITIGSDRLIMQAGGTISSATRGLGNAGTIRIQSTDSIQVDGSLSSVQSGVDTAGVGRGGSIDLQTPQLQLTNGGKILSQTFGGGIAGNINLQFNQLSLDNQAEINSRSISTSDAGNINVTGQSISLSNDSLINAATSQSGRGGTISLTTQTLDLDTNSRLSTATAGTGNAGNFILQADQVSLLNNSNFTSSSTGSSGDAGSLGITANSLSLQDSSITSSSAGAGKAGTVTLQVRDSITANNGQVSTSNVDGQGGQLQLNTTNLIIANNSLIDSSTTGQGNAGQVIISARSATTLNNSTISSRSSGSGNGGEVTFNTSQLSLTNNAQLSTASSGTGTAGNLDLQVQQTTLQDGSQITTRSTGTGNGGTITLTGNTLTFYNGSALNASTVAGNGGNLNITLSGLLDMRTLNQLNAEAGGTGNGGNINLKALFLVGLGNSDIIANAIQGRGGNIQITTQGIFGLAFRPQLTPSNDITASSQFGISGTVQVNTIGNDPNSGLLTLPASVTDSSQQIAKGCIVNQDDSFIITGRGGLPENPTQELRYDRPWGDLRDLSAFRKPGNIAVEKTDPNIGIPSKPFTRAVTSWIHHPNGMVEMVATHAQPTTALSPVASCSGRLNG